MRESTLSETTKRNYESNQRYMQDKKRTVLAKASEREKELYKLGNAVIDYRNMRVARL